MQAQKLLYLTLAIAKGSHFREQGQLPANIAPQAASTIQLVIKMTTKKRRSFKENLKTTRGCFKEQR